MRSRTHSEWEPLPSVTISKRCRFCRSKAIGFVALAKHEFYAPRLKFVDEFLTGDPTAEADALGLAMTLLGREEIKSAWVNLPVDPPQTERMRLGPSVHSIRYAPTKPKFIVV
jgi:hypothetical protein